MPVSRRKDVFYRLSLNLLSLLNQTAESRERIREILTAIQHASGIEAVGIRLREGTDYPYYEVSGFSQNFTELEHSVCAVDPDGKPLRDSNGNFYLECMCGLILNGSPDTSLPFFTTGGSFWTNNTDELKASLDTDFLERIRFRGNCLKEGYKSVALIPLQSEDRQIGLLQLNDSRADVFTPDIIEFFEQIGTTIAIAFEKKQSEERLVAAKEKLEEKVRSRTNRLFETNKKLRREIERNRQTVAQLKKSQTSLAEAQRIAHLGNWDWNIERNTLHWSDEIYRIFGVDAKTFSATYEAFLGFVHPEDRQAVEDAVRNAIENNTLYRIEHRIRLSDKTERVVREEAEVYYDENGNPQRMIGTVQDITQAKDAENRLAYQGRIFRSLYKIATSAGDSFEEICDQVILSISRLLSVPFVVLKYRSESGLETVATVVDGALARPEVCVVDCGAFDIIQEEGKPLQVVGNLAERFPKCMFIQQNDFRSYIGIPIKNSDDSISGLICIMDTREKFYTKENIRLIALFSRYLRNEIEKQGMREELRRSEEMKVMGQLTSGVAHEVRNPLNAIMALSEALFREIEHSERYTEYLAHIRDQIQQLSSLMNDLLELGRPVAERAFKKIRLEDVCRGAVESFTHAKRYPEKDIRLSNENTNGPSWINGDPVRLKQVFVNLLDNAAQHSGKECQIDLRILPPEKGLIPVVVSDRGPGIDEELMDSIFTPFFTTRNNGTGLGLSIVKHTVESHKGRIRFWNSKESSGCNVEVRLPAVE